MGSWWPCKVLLSPEITCLERQLAPEGASIAARSSNAPHKLISPEAGKIDFNGPLGCRFAPLASRAP